MQRVSTITAAETYDGRINRDHGLVREAVYSSRLDRSGLMRRVPGPGSGARPHQEGGLSVVPTGDLRRRFALR